jgi:hypothetical protein
MVIAGTLAGVVDSQVSFHYDLSADVLYLRLVDQSQGSPIGEDTDDDLVLFRDEETDQVVGLDVISWWKRFGEGSQRDSIQELTRRVEPLAQRLLAEYSSSVRHTVAS